MNAGQCISARHDPSDTTVAAAACSVTTANIIRNALKEYQINDKQHLFVAINVICVLRINVEADVEVKLAVAETKLRGVPGGYK